MNCSLQKGEIFSLEAALENELRCLKGHLWITVGDGIDYLVTDSCPLRRLSSKRVLIEALEDSEIRIQGQTGKSLSIGFHKVAGFMAGV